jgi:hypothetical protein
MLQSYGVAPPTNVDTHMSDDLDEARALLGTNSSAIGSLAKRKEGHATLVSSVSNLLNTIIGSGTFKRLYLGIGILIRHKECLPSLWYVLNSALTLSG